MIREWCDQCGSRFEPGFVDYWGNVRPGRCPYACDLGVSDLPEWSTCEVAELFWTAIAHERAKLTSTNGWCDACGERACGCSTDPSEKGRV